MSLTADQLFSNYTALGVQPEARVAVAVSGGADSLCLLLLTAQKFDAVALTVDHGLRAEATAEAGFVAAVCKANNIKHIVLNWEGEKPCSNVQAEARAARYALMKDWCLTNETRYLAVGHHRDDQAETLLLRLARGSGVYGLAAMPAKRDIGGVSIVRPLLDYSKSDITDTLKELDQDWVEDPSNQSEVYDRIKVRKLLVDPPLDGLTPERLAGTASRLRRSRNALEHYEQLWLSDAVEARQEGYLILKKTYLDSEPEEIILRGLATLCRFFSGGGYVPRMEKLLRLRDALINPAFTGHTLYGVKFSAQTGGDILVSREMAAIEGAIPLEKTSIWDNRFEIEATGDISGVKVAALGAEGWSKLKAVLLDFDQIDIPRLAGLALPAIYLDAELRAVPHLGYNTLEDIEIKLSLKTDILTKKVSQKMAWPLA